MEQIYFGQRIASLRKERKMTQEALAQQLGITNQAVSKWESDQCCPDIMQLPALADLFGITMDALFGREAPAAPEAEQQTIRVEDLPWEDNSDLHAVCFVGRRLVQYKDIPSPGGRRFSCMGFQMNMPGSTPAVTLEFSGAVNGIQSDFSVNCGCAQVNGNIQAGEAVTCGDVAGSVFAGDSVTCKSIGSGVQAGDSLRCEASVSATVSVNGDLRCGGNIHGSVQCSGDLECDGSVNGSVKVEGDARIEGSVSGNVTASGNLECSGDIGGKASAEGNLECGGTILGSASAQGNIRCSTIHGDAFAEGDVFCTCRP